MISESKWIEGWVLLVGAFGGHLKSEATGATYAAILRPLMDDATWARTVLAVCHRGDGVPQIGDLIDFADEAREPYAPRPSEVARAREECPRVDSENYPRLLAEAIIEGTSIGAQADRLLDPGGRLLAFLPRGPRR